MRYKMFTLLVSGIFSLTLLPLTTVSAEVTPQYYGNAHWRPMPPGRGVVPPAPFSFSDTQHYAAQRMAWQRRGTYPNNVNLPYRFRPMQGDARYPDFGSRYSWRHTGNRSQNVWRGDYPVPRYPTYTQSQQPHNSIYPPHAYWQMPAQNYAPGYQDYVTTSGYHFRPQNAQQRMVSQPNWTYRPAQIQIPNHYVYRPLRVVKQQQTQTQQRTLPVSQYTPPLNGYFPGNPMSYDRAAYRPRNVEQNLPPNRRYIYGNGYARVQPQYGATPWAAPGYRYPVSQAVSGYRYPVRKRFDRPQFRPLNQPRLVGYPDQPNRFRQNIYPTPPGYPVMNNRWPYPVGMVGVRQPTNQVPYPMPPGRVAQQPASSSRYGVDWYDGQSDGDGAWYKLAEQQGWPNVSQNVQAY